MAKTNGRRDTGGLDRRRARRREMKSITILCVLVTLMLSAACEGGHHEEEHEESHEHSHF